MSESELRTFIEKELGDLVLELTSPERVLVRVMDAVNDYADAQASEAAQFAILDYEERP